MVRVVHTKIQNAFLVYIASHAFCFCVDFLTCVTEMHMIAHEG
jgi:hypothetical protein